MHLNRALNLIIPIERADGTKIYAHVTPIAYEVFDAHYKVISMAFSRIMLDASGAVAGTRVADKILRDVAKELGAWEDKDGSPGVQRSLVGEIHRLTKIVAPAMGEGREGWDALPFALAHKRGVIDDEDAQDIDAQAVFFSVMYWMQRKSERAAFLRAGMSLWKSRVESLTSTELIASLAMSKQDDSTGETASEKTAPQASSPSPSTGSQPQDLAHLLRSSPGSGSTARPTTFATGR